MTTFFISSASTSARQGTLQTTPLSTTQFQLSSRDCTPAAMNTSHSSTRGQALHPEHSNGAQAAADLDTSMPFNDPRFLPHLVIMLIPALINLLTNRIYLFKLTFCDQMDLISMPFRHFLCKMRHKCQI